MKLPGTKLCSCSKVVHRSGQKITLISGTILNSAFSGWSKLNIKKSCCNVKNSQPTICWTVFFRQIKIRPINSHDHLDDFFRRSKKSWNYRLSSRTLWKPNSIYTINDLSFCYGQSLQKTVSIYSHFEQTKQLFPLIKVLFASNFQPFFCL